jgi:cell division protease FtsH
LNPFYKNLALWMVISLVMILLFNMFNQSRVQERETSYTEFMARVENGDVARVVIRGQEISGTDVNGVRFKTFAPQDGELIKTLRDHGVTIEAKPPAESPWYMTVLVSWFPMVLLIAVWIFFMRQMQGGGGKALSFGKSRARLLSDQSAKVTFEDVAGIDEAKEELS